MLISQTSDNHAIAEKPFEGQSLPADLTSTWQKTGESSSQDVTDFLDQNYPYKSAVTQIPQFWREEWYYLYLCTTFSSRFELEPNCIS